MAKTTQVQKLWVLVDTNNQIVGTTFSRAHARQGRVKGDKLFSVALTKTQLKQIVSGVNS